jgi:adenine-specific DNA-methyltransferase
MALRKYDYEKYLSKSKKLSNFLELYKDKPSTHRSYKLHLVKFFQDMGITDIDKYVKDTRILSKKEMKLIKPYYTAKELNRYTIRKDDNEWIIYTKSNVNKHISNYPKIRKHLDQYKQVITSAFGPYGLHRARKEEFFLGEKILCARKTKQPSFSYVNFPSYVSRMFISIKPKEKVNLKSLTGILNSKLMHFWLYFKGKREGNQLQVDVNPILEIPIKIPSKSMQQSFAKLVDEMISYNKRLDKVSDKRTDERRKIEREIRKTDAKIDELVYKLYELTKEEINIIEENLKE